MRGGCKGRQPVDAAAPVARSRCACRRTTRRSSPSRSAMACASSRRFFVDAPTPQHGGRSPLPAGVLCAALPRRRDRAACARRAWRLRHQRNGARPHAVVRNRDPGLFAVGPADAGCARSAAPTDRHATESMYTQQGVLDRESVVERYGQMVRRVAAQLVARLPANVDIDDLVQAGMIGLLDAVSRYDASQGTQFETFAMQRVRGAMLDELRGSDWMPRSVRRNQRTIESRHPRPRAAPAPGTDRIRDRRAPEDVARRLPAVPARRQGRPAGLPGRGVPATTARRVSCRSRCRRRPHCRWSASATSAFARALVERDRASCRSARSW